MYDYLQEEASEGLLHICMYCHKHRNDAGYWEKDVDFQKSFLMKGKAMACVQSV
jgi:hypothetical protein